MLQPQLVNLAPNLQPGMVKPQRNAAPDSPGEAFGKVLDHRTTALIGEKFSAMRSNNSEITPAPEEQLNLEQANIYALPLITPPAEQQPIPITLQEQWERAGQIMQSIVSILEGNHNNISVDTEIAPLLQELEQIMRELQTQPIYIAENIPQTEEFLEVAMARMPEMADLQQKLDKLNKFIETLRGYLSPLENVNEDRKPIATEAEIIPLKPAPAPKHTAGAQADADNNAELKSETKSEPAITQTQAPADIAPQKVLFAERLAAAEAPRFMNFTAENLFDAMIERIVQLPGAEPHLEIALKPDHLGKVSVDLVMGQNGLTAKIIASDEGVRNMLAAQLNSLSETLAEKGIRVESVEVTYSALADKPFDHRQPEQQGQSSKNYSRRDISLAGPHDTAPNWWDTAYDMPLYADDGGLGLSSVEYRA